MKPSLEKKLGKVTYNEQVIELSGGSEEWQPNPTWWDIKTILENDTREYAHKSIVLLKDDEVTQTIKVGYANAYATSDGAFYELQTYGDSITHTWDTSQDKPCLIEGKEVYKTRYLIVYTNQNIFKYISCYSGIDSLYIISQDMGENEFAGSVERDYNLEAIEGDILGKQYNLSGKFRYCCALAKFPDAKDAKLTTLSDSFTSNTKLKSIHINTAYASSTIAMFSGCSSLIDVGEIDLSSCTSSKNMFHNCYALKTIRVINTGRLKDANQMFSSCENLEYINDFDTSSVTDMTNMFYYCENLKDAPRINTSSATKVQYLFNGCSRISKIYELNLINSTSNYGVFSNCYSLRSITVKNIKLALQIGSGSSWGHLLTLDSLLNTIKELWDNTSGTSTLTLTVSTPSKTLLQNTYVKLVDITDEMRAEDEYIDNKKPFVVCESTDEGAMTAEEYVISKNWQLA